MKAVTGVIDDLQILKFYIKTMQHRWPWLASNLQYQLYVDFNVLLDNANLTVLDLIESILLEVLVTIAYKISQKEQNSRKLIYAREYACCQPSN